MSIVILTEPNQLVTSLNDIIIEGYENDIASSSGTSSRGFLVLQDFHLENDYFTIRPFVDGYYQDFVFTCKSTVTNNKTQYPLRTTESLAEWGEKVKDTIIRNSYIIDHFKITTYVDDEDGYYSIYFEPYVQDGTVRLTWYQTIISVDYSTQDSNYSDPEYYDYLNMALQLYVEELTGATTGQLEKYQNPLIVPPEIYRVPLRAHGRWNLKELIKNEYNEHFTFPLEEDVARHIWNIVNKYKALVYSIFDDPPIAQNNKFTDDFYVLDAKFSETKIRRMNSNNQSLIDLLTETKQFLTNAPLEKKTDIYTPEKLNWLFLQDYSGAKLRVKEYYTDGTNDTRTITTFNISAWQIIEFDVGFQTIKRDDYETEDIIPWKWEIWLETDVGSFISDIRTFIIDKTYQRYARYWIFKNRFGVYEAFRTVGKIKKINKISKTFFEKEAEEPDFSDRNISQIDEKSELQFEVNIGFLDKQWIKYYADEFMISRDVYWITGENKYAATILEASPVFEEDDIYNNSYSFKAIILDVDDKFYDEFDPVPELPVLGDFNGDFNDDYLI